MKLITKKNRKVRAKNRNILEFEPDNFNAAVCSFVKRKEKSKEVKVVTDISTGLVANAM